MGFWDAVVLMFLIGAVAWLRAQRHGAGGSDRLDRRGRHSALPDSRESELEAEIAELHKRIAVLERIATEERKSRDIAAEIEALRDAPRPESGTSPERRPTGIDPLRN
jgi:hypothetical protein